MNNIYFKRAVYLLPIFIVLFSLAFAADTPEKKDKELININTASAGELETLPGIGPSLAKRIVEFREQNGPFKKNEDIMKVRGIGEKNFLKIKDLITVGKVKE